MPSRAKRCEHILGVRQRLVPGVKIGLLRADMERHAMRVQSKRIGMAQHVHCHRGHAAEFARQRPFRALAIGQHAAEHFRAGRNTGDLVDLFDGINSEQADAKLIGAGNVALFLDRVAKRDAVSGRARIHRHFDFGNGCRIKA